MTLPWWGWILVGLVLFVGYGVVAAKQYRTALRREFRAFLENERPDLRVAEETGAHLRLETADGEDAGIVYLRRLYVQGPREEEDKRAMFAALVASIAEAEVIDHLTPEHRDRVMPRLVTDRILAAMRAQVRQELPAVPLELEGLHAVFVLDSENSVAYLGSDQLTALGLTPEAALAVARENLGKQFGPEIVRQAVASPDLHVVKSFDTYDAARLLLLPGYLAEGETLVAMIPDRDTLVLTQPPSDGDWSAMWRLARNAAGEPLYTKPIVVSAAGLSAAPP